MAQDFSFDVVSQFDPQEMSNAVDQARREIGTRFDFKGTEPKLEYDGKEISLEGQSEFHLNQIMDILLGKAASRKIPAKVFKRGKVEDAAKGRARQKVELQSGIKEELARDLVKRIKSVSPKVQSQIQGDQLRVSSRDKDLLQKVIAELRGADLPVDLQFINYR
ncbi:MAG: YajQ family cyclic di-GMP-binding protein [Candidatus Dormibacteria bacterium]